MTMRNSVERDWGRLVQRILSQGPESEIVEYKENNPDPEMIGKRISALSNGAILRGGANGYLVWGVRDDDLHVVGTNFDPLTAKGKGNEDLLPWLSRHIHPRLDIQVGKTEVDGARVVVMEVPAAGESPTTFQKEAYIRRQSYCKKLVNEPDLEKRLWAALNNKSFEGEDALQDLDESDLLELIDYPAYFNLLRQPLPENRKEILDALVKHGIVGQSVSRGWAISNVGGLLLARDLRDFPRLDRKAVRVVVYDGSGRMQAVREPDEHRGYAVAFQSVIEEVDRSVPVREEIVDGLRREWTEYPEIAVRELVANALVHQDLSVHGAGPMVEVFADRIEISNPGRPVTNYRRFVDSAPVSRNERVARLMRLFGICEERGSGWDKVIYATEQALLPAPRVKVEEDATRVTLLGARPLSTMDQEDRTNAIYLHACLRYVNQQPMTNASVRERFGVANRKAPQVSRFINESIDEGLVVVYDPNVGKKSRRYVPFWASPRLREPSHLLD
jgi:putative transcriptional regulator